MRKNRYNDDIYKKIATEYAGGTSSKEIGSRYGFSIKHVLRIVNAHGIRSRTQRENKLGKPNLKKRVFSVAAERSIASEYRAGKTLKEIAQPRRVTLGLISHVLKRCKVKTRTKWEYGKSGKYCSRWSGGRTTNESGHVRIPARNHSKWKFEHRAIMEKHLGRPLEPFEVVHHKNGVPDDNRIRNLQVMSKREHQKLHAGEQGLGIIIKGGKK